MILVGNRSNISHNIWLLAATVLHQRTLPMNISFQYIEKKSNLLWNTEMWLFNFFVQSEWNEANKHTHTEPNVISAFQLPWYTWAKCDKIDMGWKDNTMTRKRQYRCCLYFVLFFRSLQHIDQTILLIIFQLSVWRFSKWTGIGANNLVSV